MNIQTINPANAQILQTYPYDTDSTVTQKLLQSHQAFLIWKTSDHATRSRCLHQLADALTSEKSVYAKLIMEEMGKPITQAYAEIEKCALLCHFYADNLTNFLADRIIPTEACKSLVSYEPLGSIFLVMPWNYPFWQVIRAAVPTIAAGNTILLKHAPNTTGAGIQITELFQKAGFPQHVLQQLILPNTAVEAVIASPYVQGVSFTGSVPTGTIIARHAASCLKKCILELGGNDPYLILDDADLFWAAECIIKSRLNNCGQVCIAAKRILVTQKHYKTLQSLLLEQIKSYKCMSPDDENCLLGPLARADLRTTLHEQIKRSIAAGAICLTGGTIPEGAGYYYPATILGNVTPGMAAFEEELFGPVISLIPCNDETEMLILANQSAYGLAAAIFTQDTARGEMLARHHIDTGVCFVNRIVSSDPRLPFGGIKNSGYGRELSQEGVLAFVNVKTIVIEQHEKNTDN